MIDVIVCSKHGGELFIRCLDALLKQKELNNIIVVTPSNETEAYRIASNYKENVFVIVEPHNSCLAWARRLGVESVSTEYVAYVDADVVLGQDHLTQLKAFAEKLSSKYEHFAVEGMLSTLTIEKNTIIREDGYRVGPIPPGGRGCTHNTILPRKTLELWSPPYGFAWEDWLLTQHVQGLGGVWIRYPQNVRSIHIRDYGSFKRAAWDNAGERLLKQDANLGRIFKRMFMAISCGFRDCLRHKNVNILLSRSILAWGMLIGYLKWPQYVKLKLD